MSTPIITVYGALGRQGAGVVSAFESAAAAGHYQIRALSSSITSPGAVALASKPNIEVVQVDVNSLESLRTAFAGSNFLYANTMFNMDMAVEHSPQVAEEYEVNQGLNIAKAAVAAQSTLRHFVWSGFPDIKEQTRGKYDIPHLQAKIPAEKYILSHPELAQVTTFLRVAFYDVNVLARNYKPIYSPMTNTHVLMFPCSPSGLIPFAGDVTHNVGVMSRAIFDQPEKTKGKAVALITEAITPKQWAANLDKVAKRRDSDSKVAFVNCTLKEYENIHGVLGMEIGWMMQYYDDDENHGWTYTTKGPSALLPRDLGVADQLRSVQDTLEWF